MKQGARLSLAILAATALASPVFAADAGIPSIAVNQHNEKTDFTDAEIIDGFLKTTFGAEYQLAGKVDRIRKFDKPVRVFITGADRPDRSRQIETVTADIGEHIDHLDIAVTEHRDEANLIVRLVRDRDLDSSIRKSYGTTTARKIRKSLNPQCLSGFRKNSQYEIEYAEVILTVDSGDFVFFDCAYEEMLQSLGPINDTGSVPWTMFNDSVSMGFFDTYDRYLLNILYDPRVKAGMSVDQVRPLLPAILKDIRARIAPSVKERH